MSADLGHLVIVWYLSSLFLFASFPQAILRTPHICVIGLRRLTNAGPCARHRRDQHLIERVYENRLYEKGRRWVIYMRKRRLNTGSSRIENSPSGPEVPNERTGPCHVSIAQHTLNIREYFARVHRVRARAITITPSFPHSRVLLSSGKKRRDSNVPYPTPSYPRGISYPAKGTNFALFSTWKSYRPVRLNGVYWSVVLTAVAVWNSKDGGSSQHWSCRLAVSQPTVEVEFHRTALPSWRTRSTEDFVRCDTRGVNVALTHRDNIRAVICWNWGSVVEVQLLTFVVPDEVTFKIILHYSIEYKLNNFRKYA